MRQRSPRARVTVILVGILSAATASGASAAAGAWSTVPVPNPDAQFTYLQSVDARTDTDAWIAGYLTPSGGGPNTPIALHWNGSAWASTTVPQLGIGTLLWGVSASAADDAWAVGSFSTRRPGYSPQTNSAALHWDGRAWTQVAIPNSATLFGVADISPSNAWAVGATLKHWDGVSWTDVAVPAPAPNAGPGPLYGVSARSADDVWAVGNYAPRRHVTSGFSVHFDGTAWRSVPTPAGVELWSVTAAGVNDAWAVGQLDGSTEQAAALHWNGIAWSLVATPTVPHGVFLRSVSARSGNDVWAAGPAFTGEAGSVDYYSIHWNGSAWSRVATPALSVPDVWAVSARAGGTHVWSVGTRSTGAPLVLERH